MLAQFPATENMGRPFASMRGRIFPTPQALDNLDGQHDCSDLHVKLAACR